jgi:hypothetical protein
MQLLMKIRCLSKSSFVFIHDTTCENWTGIFINYINLIPQKSWLVGILTRIWNKIFLCIFSKKLLYHHKYHFYYESFFTFSFYIRRYHFKILIRFWDHCPIFCRCIEEFHRFFQYASSLKINLVSMNNSGAVNKQIIHMCSSTEYRKNITKGFKLRIYSK